MSPHLVKICVMPPISAVTERVPTSPNSEACSCFCGPIEGDEREVMRQLTVTDASWMTYWSESRRGYAREHPLPHELPESRQRQRYPAQRSMRTSRERPTARDSGLYTSLKRVWTRGGARTTAEEAQAQVYLCRRELERKTGDNQAGDSAWKTVAENWQRRRGSWPASERWTSSG